MRRLLIGFVWIALLCAHPSAQAPQLLWDAPSNVPTLAVANALVWTLYVNNGAAVVVTGAVCTGTTVPFACASPVPTGTPTVIGTRLELTAKDAASGVESPRSLPFLSPPTAPTAFRRQ